MSDGYELWRAELKSPTPEDRRSDRVFEPKLMSGFWRIVGARTKPDYPVAIWTQAGNAETIFQIGRKQMRTDTHEREWHEFVGGGWLKCVAVSQADWDAALTNSQWADGKPSREVTIAEKADIIPTTAKADGGNEDVDENGAPIDHEWVQIKGNIERDAEALKALGTITSLEVANKAAAIIERLRANGTLGETRRKAEKKPHDDAAAAVQAKWVPVLKPASELVASTITAIDKWKKAEEKRLAAVRAEEERKERERIAEEEAKRLAEEEAERARQAEAMGIEHQAQSEDDIKAEAEARAAEQVQQQMPAPEKVRVGTAHGRGISKNKITKGRIVDVDAFFQAIKEHAGTEEFLQTAANRLARAGAKVPGMEIYTE